MRAFRVLCLLWAASMAGCSCGTVIGEDLRFACGADPECGDDHRCFQGSCLRADDPVFRVCVPEVCDDGEDNDCDGKTDCQDPDCCSACGTCELDCADGADDDSDGQTDCADPDCADKGCGPHGRVCVAGACACATGRIIEIACADGVDDDCDGLVDCADPDCAGQGCGPNKVCAGGSCACAGQATTETACGDGVDDDCDGLVDCADPDCLLQGCSASAPGAVCCSTGPNSTACRDLRSDKSHCGGCGLSCGNRNCNPVTGPGGEVHGACACTQNGHCRDNTLCQGGFCACASAAACAQGQTCETSGLCAYPQGAP